jgi:hypothetical protein
MRRVIGGRRGASDPGSILPREPVSGSRLYHGAVASDTPPPPLGLQTDLGGGGVAPSGRRGRTRQTGGCGILVAARSANWCSWFSSSRK